MKAWIAALLLALASASSHALDVAITVDDMPVHGQLPPGVTRLAVAEAHLRAFKAHGVGEAWGFVNAKGAEAEGDAVLAVWRKAGHPLGNHTFSHMNLGRAASLEAWTADVIAGEPLVEKHMAGADWHWFRYPNLSVGDGERRDAALAFLRERGYRIADVSLAFTDWDYTDAHVRCRALGDEASITAMKTQYLAGVDTAIGRARADAQAVFGRPIKHVLLTHLGAFSAETLPDVLARLDAAGARYIGLAEAMSDPAYQRHGGGSVIAREAKAGGRQLPAPPPAAVDPKTLCRT